MNTFNSILAAFLVVSCATGLSAQEYRSLDGYGNNFANPRWGSAGAEMPRFAPADYSDGVSAPTGINRPNPRDISNHIFDQKELKFDLVGLSDYVWVFGQFIDHDFALVFDDHEESAVVRVPMGDEHFDPESLGMAIIPMFRSQASAGTGISRQSPREHDNAISAFIDASGVYGSDEARAHWLRSFEDGKLKVSEGNMLPWNTTTGEYDAPVDPAAPLMADDTRANEKLYVAGDLRANENVLLLSMHALLVREHNRICDVKKAEHPEYTDEELYQEARRWVAAYLQAIVYNEWLPTMGIELPAYEGYDPFVRPDLFNEFSGAAFRLGHTMINSEIPRLDADGLSIPEGPISLKDAFFAPQQVKELGSLDPMLRGMSVQIQQDMDDKLIDDLRNFLFGLPGFGGLDLASINIQRGRERGLVDFNNMRLALGYAPYSSFDQIHSDPAVYQGLEHMYGNVNDIDLWVGLLAEQHIPGTMLGETITEIIRRQFTVLRDGDRFFYLNDDAFTSEEQERISSTTLADIIKRNSGVEKLPTNVFKAREFKDIDFERVDLEPVDMDVVAFPNPTVDILAFSTYSLTEADMDVIIYNPLGTIVYQDKVQIAEGVNNFTLDAFADYPAGAYLLVLQRGEESTSRTIIKK